MLTREEAVRETKELWEAINASGMSKDGFLNSQDIDDKFEHVQTYANCCPLCELSFKVINIPSPDLWCPTCPLVQQYGVADTRKFTVRCYNLGYDDCTPPSERWMRYIRGLK
jgi:hypothetical protein